MPGGSVIPFNIIESSLSSLKSCQSYINVGMDLATNVALDLVESSRKLFGPFLDKALAEASNKKKHTLNQVQSFKNFFHKPETIPDLKVLVKEKLVALESRNSESELLRNEKFVHFKEQLQKMKTQFGLQSVPDENEALEQLDEDIAVTQSQVNFICPITQADMKKPVRNKTCGHTYEEEAILKLIQHKEKRQKKACCPKVGCNNLDVKRSDLVPDEALKRAIESQNK
uniref:E3 SUMO-protein ligase NSE2 n=1 Tax=Sphenodon punctatus TaxID=8508 RepID=A0A8D0HK96_SPHPU